MSEHPEIPDAAVEAAARDWVERRGEKHWEGLDPGPRDLIRNERRADLVAAAPAIHADLSEERDQDSGDSFDARIRHAQKRGAGAVVEQLRKEKVQAEIRTRDKEKKQQ